MKIHARSHSNETILNNNKNKNAQNAFTNEP